MPGLWNVDDQAARLAELTSHESDLKEAPLRRDVRSLGRLLGEVLKEQVGDKLFSAVEELRLLLIERLSCIFCWSVRKMGLEMGRGCGCGLDCLLWTLDDLGGWGYY